MVAALSLVCSKSKSLIFSAVPKEQTEENVAKNLDKEIHTLDYFYKISESAEEFLRLMEYSPAHVAEIEAKTRGQSENPLWFSVRKHMITASKAHDVKTRMETLHKGCGKRIDFSSIFSKISGEKGINSDLPALQYGRAMENEAATSFKSMFEKTHKNVKLEECGIYLCEDMPFLGGNPDGIVSCDCCGKFCLEVKCPFSISHTSPMDPDAKLPYLNRSSDQALSINRNHKYFTQCQIQMAASKVEQGYFYVWTSHGYFMEKVTFDRELWCIQKQKCLKMFKNVGPLCSILICM